jgi:hypothetical protein
MLPLLYFSTHSYLGYKRKSLFFNKDYLFASHGILTCYQKANKLISYLFCVSDKSSFPKRS